jgi:hypothetical protein
MATGKGGVGVPRRTTNYESIEESGYEPDDEMQRYCADKYPTVDVDGTFELFRDNALSHDKVFASWPAAFRTWLRNGLKYGGIVYRSGLSDPAFAQLIQEADGVGFRRPLPKESAGAYRTALRSREPPRSDRVVNFSGLAASKRMAK